MALRALQGPVSGTPVGGSGTPDTIPRWTGPSTLGDSVITQDGSIIGIRQATPSAYLAGFNTLVVGDPTLANTGITLASGTASDGTFAFADGTVGNAAYRGYIQYKHATDTMQIGTAASPQITILSTGNVGIGTASPISPLHVKGNATNTDGILTLTPNSGGRNHQVQSLQASSLFRIFDQSAGVSRLEIDINGNISATTTGGTFNASTSGAGLKLQGTGGTNNTDPNVLDFYADGGTANSGGVTWTPALRFGGATTGITGSQVGRYTRIGNMVFAQGTIALSSKGSATGAASIAGLPTSANVAATIYYSIAIGYNSKVTFTGQLHGLISVNSGIVELYQTSTAGVVSAITNTDFAADSVLTFTVCYPVT